MQKRGIGTKYRLEGYIKETIAPDWAVGQELISTKAAVLFYQKKGFEERPCEYLAELNKKLIHVLY